MGNRSLAETGTWTVTICTDLIRRHLSASFTTQVVGICCGIGAHQKNSFGAKYLGYDIS